MPEQNFFYYNEIINKLKEIRRTGWIRSHISGSETVAEHILHVSIISLVLISHVSSNIDTFKVLALSLIHDLPEAIYGDIPSPEKNTGDIVNEKMWLKSFLKNTGYPVKWAEDLFELRDLESKIVKFSDLTATLTQGLEYSEKYGCRGYLKEIIYSNIQNSKKILESVDDTGFMKYAMKIIYDAENRYNLLCEDKD